MIDDGSPITETDFPNAAQDLRVALQAHDLGLLRSLGICLPACVYSYDRSTHTAEVMPLVKQAFFNGKWEYIRKQTFKVSVRNIQCGGFTIDVPVFVGDTGWVFSSDRDTLLVKREGSLTNSVLERDRSIAIVEDDYQQKPNTPTLHSFVYGFFIPDNWGAWETHRYKDNPGVAVGSSLYIGSSIDTDDKRNDVDGKKYQKGDAYEKKNTSSIVMSSNGNVSIASSSPTATNQNAQFDIGSKSVSMSTNDYRKGRNSSINVDAEDGIVIRQDIEAGKEWEDEITKSDGSTETKKYKNERHQHFVCSILPGKFYLRLIDEENVLNFSFQDGKLSMSTSSDLNMSVGGNTAFRCSGDVDFMGEGHVNVNTKGEVNVRAGKEAYVAAKEARVVAEGDASVVAKNVTAAAAENAHVNAGNTVNIGAVKTTNINAGQKVNLAAGNDINITAPDTVNIVTANNATIMAKKKGAKVLVTTLSKDSSIDVIAKGANTKMNMTFEKKESDVKLTMKEKDSSVSIVTEKDNSPVDITTKGNYSDITIAAQKSKMTVKADKDLLVESMSESVNIKAGVNVNVEAAKDVNVKAGSNATVTAGSSATVQAGGPAKVIGSGVEVQGNDVTLKSNSLHFLGRNIYLGGDSKDGTVKWN